MLNFNSGSEGLQWGLTSMSVKIGGTFSRQDQRHATILSMQSEEAGQAEMDSMPECGMRDIHAVEEVVVGHRPVVRPHLRARLH